MTLIRILLITCLFISSKANEKEKVNNIQTLKWKLISSDSEIGKLEDLSKLDNFSNNWIDAGEYSTILGALVRNGKYKKLFVDDNFDKLPKDNFDVPWYYKSIITIKNIKEYDNYTLKFNGINYKADLWVNGKEVKLSKELVGPYKVHYIDVTGYLKDGNNVILCKVYPPKKSDLTIGWVDWNPWPKDKNTGLWRSVELIKSKFASLSDIFIKPKFNDNSFNSADIDISAKILNYNNANSKYTVRVEIENKIIKKTFSIPGNQVKNISISAKEYLELTFNNPKLWWPNNMGKPNLYEAKISLLVDDIKIDEKRVKFGFRKIEDYLTKEGYRGYKINGKKVLIKGAGWTDDILLADTDSKVEKQIKYVKDMNLNTIRLEGFWGNNNRIYELCDENGILVMVGLSCHWEWKDYCGREDDEFMAVRGAEEIKFITESYKDQILNLRNHPSLFIWVFGSDKLPRPEFEKSLIEVTKKYDGTRPTLSSCRGLTADGSESNISTITGSPRVKMLGPYSYVTPNYWYIDTTHGGAYGFNTETGPGLQPPIKESLEKMLSPENLWPINEYWDYHTGRSAFKTMNRWLVPFINRYGKCKDLDEFTLKAQMSNYEAVKAMFEAFRVNKPSTTGIIQWMLNSSWPSMLWQLYDWYLNPTGAYFGTKTACQPFNLIYNYKNGFVYIVSEQNNSADNLTAEIKVFDSKFNPVTDENIKTAIEENESQKLISIDESEISTNLYFLSLKLYKNKKLLSKNFYWLSKKKDVQDFEKSNWYITPNKEYADFTEINNLPKCNIEVAKVDSGKNYDKYIFRNKSDKIAFSIQIKTYNENNEIIPALISDNYFSLIPGEEYVIIINKFDRQKINMKYRFWNEE